MTTPKLEMATLTQMDAEGKREVAEPIKVQFNPQTIQINYSFVGNRGSVGAAKNTAEGSATQQSNHRTDHAVTLSSLNLFFDTTENGENVQDYTGKIAKLLMLPEPKVSPMVRFHWGKFIFKGTINSMQESLDYFSPDGTPLRATVTLGLSMTPDKARVAPSKSDSSGGGIAFGASLGVNAGASLSAGISASVGLSASANVNFGAAVGTSPLTLAASGDSIQNISMRAGVDWKAVASANGIDNPRKLQAGAVLNLNVKGGK